MAHVERSLGRWLRLLGGILKAIDGNLTLLVLDGVGLSSHEAGNAFQLGHTPTLDGLLRRCQNTRLAAHGVAVGMPSNADMGNSEVGHNALGSGQVVDQGALLVNRAVASGALFGGPVWRELVEFVKNRGATLHLIGLLSDGNVHSHIDHLEALLDGAQREGLKRARVHVLLDGRDVGETSAHLYLDRLERYLANQRDAGFDARIASGGGRMRLTMDRYGADWRMVEIGWQHHVLGLGRRFPDALSALACFRKEDPNVIDQYLPGFVIGDEEGPVGTIDDGDGVVFFNFRGDRAIEITQAFEAGAEFGHFDRQRRPDVYYAGMMQYDGDLLVPSKYLVGPPQISHTLTELMVEAGIPQYAISETQKYGHVTYFWNGNRSGRMAPDLERFVEVPSDLNPFDERPWMKAAEVTDALVAQIMTPGKQFLRVNYANGDMVGHTGDLNATITAMTCLDLQVARVLRAVEKRGGVALITADHGNAEEMFELDSKGSVKLDSTGKKVVKTSHTLNPVPFALYDPAKQVGLHLRQVGDLGLSNVAATVAELFGLSAPSVWRPSLWLKPS